MAATVIGQGITIEGEVTSDDEVVVGGVVRGKLAVAQAEVSEPRTIDHRRNAQAQSHVRPLDRYQRRIARQKARLLHLQQHSVAFLDAEPSGKPGVEDDLLRRDAADQRCVSKLPER